jgi:hypothetical protein
MDANRTDENPSPWAALQKTFTIPTRYVVPLFAIQLGYRTERGWGGRVSFFRSESETLYKNGVFYLRVMFPFFVGVMLRWSGSTTARAYVQAHIGWRLTGVPAAAFRVQSDVSAARGYTVPNNNQAVGWDDGNK